MAIETTLADISEAATDADLRDRFISAAAEHGVPNPQGWVESQMRRLVAHNQTQQPQPQQPIDHHAHKGLAHAGADGGVEQQQAADHGDDAEQADVGA